MDSRPSTPPPTAPRRPAYSGIGAALLMIACVAVCAAPVAGGMIAGTLLRRVLDVPVWAVVLVGVTVGCATFAVVRRWQARRGC